MGIYKKLGFKAVTKCFELRSRLAIHFGIYRDKFVKPSHPAIRHQHSQVFEETCSGKNNYQ